jgi:hypothetical protein
MTGDAELMPLTGLASDDVTELVTRLVGADSGLALRDTAPAAAAQAVLDAPNPDPLAAAAALHVLSLRVRWRDPEQSLALLDLALERAGDQPHTADLRVLLLMDRPGALQNLDRPEEVEVAIADALLSAERLGSPVRLAMCRVGAAEYWHDMGRWDDAAAELRRVEEGTLDTLPRFRLRMRMLAALLAAHRGDAASRRRIPRTASSWTYLTAPAQRGNEP